MYLATHEKGKPFIDQLNNVLEVTGERTLPRMWPPVGFLEERSAYPMLVTFGDLTDPASLAEVDPDELAATFGEGVKLKRITVELTLDVHPQSYQPPFALSLSKGRTCLLIWC